MKFLLTLTLLILYTTIFTEACSPPLNYQHLKPKEVLSNIDLVILASFISQNNLTEMTTYGTNYILQLNTQVDCILKNKNYVSVGRNIKITETRGDNWDNINTCTDYFYDIRFNTQAAIAITTHYDENRTSEFAFTQYNIQGPYYYLSGSNSIDIDEVMWVCGFQSPTTPTGGSCPSTLPQDIGCVTPQTAGVGRPTVKTALVLVVFSLLSML